MLVVFTILVVLAVGYAFFAQGLLTAFTMLVNVFVAGLIAFNFWEPIATELEGTVRGTVVHGYEDWICLIGLFCVSLVVLRVITNAIAPNEAELHPLVQQIGAAVCGGVAGYLTAGFLVCALQTLPLPEDFAGLNARVGRADGARRYLPPDRVWLALVRRGSMGPLSSDGDGFDPRGYFELGYLRHRRQGRPYRGEDLPINHE
jgi:hypothetical protein